MKTNTSPAMARGLAAIVMAFAFAQAGALSQAGISEEDRPKGSRGQEIERELTAETDREIAERGCAVVGDKKWFADSFGKPFQFQQDGCNISFKVKRENRKIQEARYRQGPPGVRGGVPPWQSHEGPGHRLRERRQVESQVVTAPTERRPPGLAAR